MKNILLIFLILIIGAINVDASDIEVENATTVWKSNVNISESLTDNASIVPDRVVVNLGDIIYKSLVYVPPSRLFNESKSVPPRIIFRYTDSVWNPNLVLSGIQFVDIKNYRYNGSYIRVPLGTTVTWINFGSRAHTVTEDNGKFDSGNLSRNQSFEYKFNLPGVYYYHCKNNPSMKGTIIVITSDKIPPASITELKNVSYAPGYINWTWKDPQDIDFEKVLVYIDGKYNAGVMKGIQHFNLTGLVSDKSYKIGTHTVDTGGNINNTWVNKTTRTKDIIPPASITGLKNVSYAPDYINWTWRDPRDLDFEKVMVYLNGKFKINVTKGERFYNATSLTSNKTYRISTHTVDTGGNINNTWVNKTARTAK